MKTVLGLILMAATALGQGIPLPYTKIQLFSNNGLPLAGGTVCTSTSGTTSPLASFTDYTLSVNNPQCVPLDSAGRASIWLDPTKLYRVVLKDSTGVTIWTQDGVSGALGGSGGGGTLWAQSGTTIYNATVGTKVCISATACTTALAELNVAGTSSGTSGLIRIDDTASNPGLSLYGGGSAMGTYGANSSGLQLRAPDGSSQLNIGTGTVTAFNGGASGGTNLRIKMSATQGSVNPLELQSSAGSNIGYFDPSGNAIFPRFIATGTGTDAIQSAGGITGVNLIATDSLFLIAEPQPALSAANQARIYLDSTSLVVNASINGAAYVPFGSGGGGSTAFSALTAGTNATAAMVVGTGASLNFTGSGTINASAINATTVPTSPAADMILITTGAGVGAWSGATLNASGLANCVDTGGNHLNYNTSTHVFTCGTSGGTVGSVSFGTITAATNTTAAMVVGSGASLTTSGTGTINATQINGGTPPVSGSVWKSNGALQPIQAVSADVVAMFSGGAGCSGSNALAADGTCVSLGGSFLPLAGGTMIGNILFNASVDVGSSISPPRTVWAGTGFASLGSASNVVNVPNGGILAQFATFNHATAPSITLQASSSTVSTWSAGATVALGVRTSSSATTFAVAQNGNTWVNRTSDDGTGAKLQVSGGSGISVSGGGGLGVSGGGNIVLSGGGSLLVLGSSSFVGNVAFTGTLTPPVGVALNGVYTCSAGQHFNQLTISQGIVTNYSCS